MIDPLGTAHLAKRVGQPEIVDDKDEGDLPDGGDASSGIVKFINLGSMKGRKIWRTVEVTLPDGGRDYDIQTFDPFVPKLVAMRKDYKDDAVGTRALTINLVAGVIPWSMSAGWQRPQGFRPGSKPGWCRACKQLQIKL